MAPHSVVIVGASLGGLRAAEAFRREGYDGRLTIVGDEGVMPYNRPPLSKQILAGAMLADDIALPIADDLRADWLLDSPAAALDLRDSKVRLANDRTVAFDRLVVATGVRPRRPTIPGLDLEGVHLLRTVADAQALKAEFQRGCRLVVVGGGLIGCEVTASARSMGLDVTLVSTGSRLLMRSLPAEIGVAFGHHHAAHGATVLLGRSVRRLEGERLVSGVVLDDGRRLAADAVVIAVGSDPCTSWLEGSGIMIADGVVCHASCMAVGGEDRVAAAGDVASWPHLGYGSRPMRVEHWSNAVAQADAAAAALLHGRDEPYLPLPSFWSDQYGGKLQVLGLPTGSDRVTMVHGSLADMKFVAETWRGERLLGIVGLNMPARVASYRTRLTEELSKAASACPLH